MGDKSDQTMQKQVWRELRYILYFAFLLNGIIIQWFAPFHYGCSLSGEKCFACGLRTSVNLLIQGHFAEAYRSNKLIVVLVIAGVIMTADVLYYLYRRHRAKRQYDSLSEI